MLLIYENPDALAGVSSADVQAVHAEMDRVLSELRASGEFLAGDGLAPVATAKTVRSRSGAVATTDGPFAETKEQFGGYALLDVASEQRALEIAARWPGLEWCSIEVRAVVGSAPE